MEHKEILNIISDGLKHIKNAPTEKDDIWTHSVAELGSEGDTKLIVSVSDKNSVDSLPTSLIETEKYLTESLVDCVANMTFALLRDPGIEVILDSESPMFVTTNESNGFSSAFLSSDDDINVGYMYILAAPAVLFKDRDGIEHIAYISERWAI